MKVRFDRNVASELSELSEYSYLKQVLDCLDIPSNWDVTIKSSNYSNPPVQTAPVTGRKNLLIYLSEDFRIVDKSVIDGYDFVAKCYLSNKQQGCYAFPIGFEKDAGAFFDFVPWEQREIDIFYAGNLNENRKELYKELFGLKWVPQGVFDRFYLSRLNKLLPYTINSGGLCIHFTGGFKKGLNPQEYMSLLCRSKVVLCPKGFHSTETFRHYEAIRAGCILWSEKLPDAWMYENSPVVQVENFNGVIRDIKKFLRDGDMVRAKHLSTKSWWDEVLAPKCVANRLSKRVRQCQG